MTLAQYTQGSVTQPSNVLQTVQGQARPQMVSKILPQQNFQVKPINVAKSLIPNQQIHISHIHSVGGKPLPMVVQSANLAQPQTPVTTMTALKRFPGKLGLIKKKKHPGFCKGDEIAVFLLIQQVGIDRFCA